MPAWEWECERRGAEERGSPSFVWEEEKRQLSPDQFQAPFFQPECTGQLSPGTLFYCAKSGKRSLNYPQINCLLPLSAP